MWQNSIIHISQKGIRIFGRNCLYPRNICHSLQIKYCSLNTIHWNIVRMYLCVYQREEQEVGIVWDGFLHLTQLLYLAYQFRKGYSYKIGDIYGIFIHSRRRRTRSQLSCCRWGVFWKVHSAFPATYTDQRYTQHPQLAMNITLHLNSRNSCRSSSIRTRRSSRRSYGKMPLEMSFHLGSLLFLYWLLLHHTRHTRQR